MSGFARLVQKFECRFRLLNRPFTENPRKLNRGRRSVVADLDQLFRSEQNPRHHEACGERLSAFHQRAVGKGRAADVVPFHEAPDPEVVITFAQGRHHLRAGITGARAVGRARGCGVLRCHAVDVLVVALVGVDQPAHQPGVPAALPHIAKIQRQGCALFAMETGFPPSRE